MSRLIKVSILVLLLSPMLFVRASGQAGIFDKFDEFGDIKCEDEYARLDNFAIQLQQEPKAKGVIIFYGGKTFRGRLPKRGEAEARAARLKPYLLRRRGIPASQIVVINAGYAEEWSAQLWIVPPGASMPTGDSASLVKKIRFRKGKPNPRDFRCRV
ncbi:MAG TPA: hypothetical protein DC054_09600 [Blastocatellia bacterium]|nr:hypothetical protein [Blastocatellia bacterium]